MKLADAGRRFESTFQIDNGPEIMGTIQPVNDGKIYPDDFFTIRRIFRTRMTDLVTPGTIIIGKDNQRYLIGQRDMGKSFNTYPLNKKVSWTRTSNNVDSLTNLPRGSGTPTNMGDIWVLIERLERDLSYSKVGTDEDNFRILTNEDVRLNDVVDGLTVSRRMDALGLVVLEAH